MRRIFSNCEHKLWVITVLISYLRNLQATRLFLSRKRKFWHFNAQLHLEYFFVTLIIANIELSKLYLVLYFFGTYNCRLKFHQEVMQNTTSNFLLSFLSAF